MAGVKVTVIEMLPKLAGNTYPEIPGVALAPRVHLEAALGAARDDGLLPDHGDLRYPPSPG